jgi:hypothetical protein
MFKSLCVYFAFIDSMLLAGLFVILSMEIGSLLVFKYLALIFSILLDLDSLSFRSYFTKLFAFV